MSMPPQVGDNFGLVVEASVVIATHDRPDLLTHLLDALAGQTGCAFEVVVVDDASVDAGAVEAVVKEAEPRFPGGLTFVRQEQNQGPAAARNRGWRTARGPVVVFTDDDCAPAGPAWLATLVAGTADAEIVQGRTLPRPDQWEGRGPFTRSLWIDRESGLYETCNIAYSRELLDQLGGFDESYGVIGGAPAWGEDTDLAWRGKGRGARTSFALDALVYCHVHPSDYHAYLRDIPRRSGLVRAVADHPGVREHFPLRSLLHPTHAWVLLSAASLAGGGRRHWWARLGLAAIGIAPWLWYRLRVSPYACRRRNLLPVLALGYVADAAETAVMAAASVRYRTLFL